jgi:hypothetical protein
MSHTQAPQQHFAYDQSLESLVEQSLLPLFSACQSQVVRVIINYPRTSPTPCSPTYSPPPPAPLPVSSSIQKPTTRKAQKGMEERPFYSKKLYPGQKQYMKRLKFN